MKSRLAKVALVILGLVFAISMYTVLRREYPKQFDKALRSVGLLEIERMVAEHLYAITDKAIDLLDTALKVAVLKHPLILAGVSGGLLVAIVYKNLVYKSFNKK